MARFTVLALALASTSALAAPPPSPFTFPSDDVALPVNARPVFFGSSAGPPVFVRIDADGETTLAFESRLATFGDEAFTVDPGPLEPATTLVIEGRCNDGFCSPLGTWSVIDAVDDAPPVFTGEVAVAAQRQRIGTGGTEADVITITIPSLADEGGPVLVRLEGAEIDEVQPDLHRTGSLDVRAVFAPGAARTTCMTVSAIDVAGNEATLPDEVCAEFIGCSQAPTSSVAFLAVLTLLLAKRKRSLR